MGETKHRHLPVWILPQLWGLDIPVAVLFWTLICAAHMQITMMSEGPILLVVVASWVCALTSRVYRAVRHKTGWYHGYYETRAVPMLLMVAAAAFAAVWMCLYYVGRHVVDFAMVPAGMLLLGFLCRKAGVRVFPSLFKALALGFSCMLPAFSLGFMAEPLQMLFCAPCWYMGILFFLLMREKELWMYDDERMAGSSNLLVSGLFLLLVVNAWSSVSAPFQEERTFSITIVMAAACLMVLSRMRPDFNKHVLFAVCWPMMAFPPLLGLLLFAPSYWGDTLWF